MKRLKDSGKGVLSRRKGILAAVVAAVLLFSAAGAVYAAFLAAGHHKGVAVGSRYFFTSDVLSGIGDAENAALTTYFFNSAEAGTATTVLFQIRNFDEDMAPTPVDIHFKISCRLRQLTEDYTYKLKYTVTDASGVSTDEFFDINSTTFQDVDREFELPSGRISAVSFSVVFTPTLVSDYTKSVPVEIKATPITPKVMESSVLGATLRLGSASSEFTVTGSFDEAVTATTLGDLDDLAGFSYHIFTAGMQDAEKAYYAQVSWPKGKLELDENCLASLGGTLSETATEPVMQQLTIPCNSDQRFTLLFFRGAEWSTPSSITDFLASVTIRKVEQLISQE